MIISIKLESGFIANNDYQQRIISTKHTHMLVKLLTNIDYKLE